MCGDPGWRCCSNAWPATTAVSARSAPDGALWIVTSNTDRATWGGTDPRPRDDRIIRIELPAQN